jgi:hypothetical protein
VKGYVTNLAACPHGTPVTADFVIGSYVCTARRYRTAQIRAGQHILTAEDPLPPDLRDALTLINQPG